MADYENSIYRSRPAAAGGAAAIDQGLRAYMIGVYQYMMLGIALTGVVAWAISAQTAFVEAVASSRLLLFVVAFAPLPFGLYLQAGIKRLSVSAAHGLFWLYAGLMGVWFGVLLAFFTDESIARVFLITAASFGALSLYGYTTKRDLSAFGSFLMIGLVGICVATLALWLFPTTMMLYAICVIGVLVFAGLTAYDTQQIKEMYYEGDDQGTASKKSILGATWLYISFVGIFQYLLYLLGNRE